MSLLDAILKSGGNFAPNIGLSMSNPEMKDRMFHLEGVFAPKYI